VLVVVNAEKQAVLELVRAVFSGNFLFTAKIG
jgi:hypothetical protein